MGSEADNDDCVLVRRVVDPPNAPCARGVVGDIRLPNVIGVSLGPKTRVPGVGTELIERLPDALGSLGVTSQELLSIVDHYAEREGFEPSVSLPTSAFKAGAFVRSATVPSYTLPDRKRRRGIIAGVIPTPRPPVCRTDSSARKPQAEFML